MDIGTGGHDNKSSCDVTSVMLEECYKTLGDGKELFWSGTHQDINGMLLEPGPTGV